MTIRHILAAMALSALVAAPVLAETAAPKASATQKGPATAPATAPIATKINLNTANAEELDKLPQIGPARAKAIVTARTSKGPFKNWDDFVARKVVPSNAERAIKDLVTF